VSLTWNIAKYPRINRRPGNGNKQGRTTHIENSRLIRLTLSIDITRGQGVGVEFQGAITAQNIIPRATHLCSQGGQYKNTKFHKYEYIYEYRMWTREAAF